MSKSLGNFFTVHDLLEQGIPGEVIRFVFLSTHYRKPMDWTAKKAAEAEKTLSRWAAMALDGSVGEPPSDVVQALADDLNTPLALAAMHALYKNGDADGLRSALELLGLGELDFGQAVKGMVYRMDDMVLGPLEVLLAETRAKAMETKDFSEVDRLKAALVAAGVEVRMSKAGVELLPAAGFDPAKLEGLL